MKNLKSWGNSGHFEVSQSSLALLVQKLWRNLVTASITIDARPKYHPFFSRCATLYRRRRAGNATTLWSQKGLKEHLGAKMLKIPYKVIILYFHTALVSLRSLAKFRSYRQFKIKRVKNHVFSEKKQIFFQNLIFHAFMYKLLKYIFLKL